MHRQGTHMRFQDLPALSPLLGAPDRSGFHLSLAPFPSNRAAWYNRQGTRKLCRDLPAYSPLLGASD
eukprot:3571741-Amphidinium_carterae.1